MLRQCFDRELCVDKDVNKDSVQNRRSMSRTYDSSQTSRPMTLYLRGLSRDFYRLNVSSFVALYYVRINVKNFSVYNTV